MTPLEEALARAFRQGAHTAEEAVAAVLSNKGETWIRRQVSSDWRDRARDTAYGIELGRRRSGSPTAMLESADPPRRVRPTHERVPLIDENGRLVPGRWDSVPFDLMTPAQHRAVATEYRKQAAGLARHADEHDEAAALIEERGVSCIAEIRVAA